MAQQSVVLLAEARERRAKAQLVRDVSRNVTDKPALDVLASYAAELDARAADLEAQASRTMRIANDIAGEIAKAKGTLAEIHHNLENLKPKIWGV